jgi:NADH-quinone oxidoreductase subunit I
MSASHGHEEVATVVGPKVLRVSAVSPKVRTVQIVRPEDRDTNYLQATATGLGVTLKHFMKNFFLPRRKPIDLGKGGAPAEAKWKNDIETVQYPEETVTYPERFRGLHRLTLREDGATRCVACMCCPTVCPANCITIVPEQVDDNGIEKRPAVFEIDELRCVVCGLCVEACPCDAIRMDTGMHAKPVEQRQHAIEDRQSLLSRGILSVAVQGGEGAEWRSSDKAEKK